MIFNIVKVFDKHSNLVVGVFDEKYFKRVNLGAKSFIGLFGKSYNNNTSIMTVINNLKRSISVLKNLIKQIKLFKTKDLSLRDYSKYSEYNNIISTKNILLRIQLYDMEYNLRVLLKIVRKYDKNLICSKFCEERCCCFEKKCIQCSFISTDNKNDIMYNYDHPIDVQRRIYKQMEEEAI